MKPVPPLAPANTDPSTIAPAQIGQGELARLIDYFETGLAELDRLGLAHCASYISWGVDLLKEQREPEGSNPILTP